MASVNKVIIVGNVGRDPEIRTFPSGDQVANVSVATTDKWKDKASGEMKEHTEWHRLVFNGKLAEIVGQYVKKGSQIYVEGSLRTRKWTDQAGVEKYATEIRGDVMQMLGGRPAGSDGSDSGQFSRARSSQQSQQSAPAAGRAPAAAPAGGGYGAMDDDIPFAPCRMWM